MSPDRDGRGLWYAVGAYALWGVFPVYWKQLAAVPAPELLAHRIVWSFAVMALWVVLAGKAASVRSALAEGRTFRMLLASTALISVNWFLFIWAVNGGRITQASLGYYLNPLLNVLVAALFLKEPFRPLQKLAVGLAAAGVVVFTVSLGTLPWVSVCLAASFCAYGLVRRFAPVDSPTGLLVETALVTPLALLALGWTWWAGTSSLPGLTGREWLFLAGSGAATALPLLWFAAGARRLSFSTLGMLQYLAPTLQLATGVWLYGEAFTAAHAATFALIWAAVGLYALDAVAAQRRAG